jgi:poly(A) polymerase
MSFEDQLQEFLSTPLGEVAYDAVTRIEDASEEAWLVGGGMRDVLLGKIPDDVDIATSALPGKIKEIFPRHASAGSAQAGEEYGSLFVKHRGTLLHITTFREDDEASDGRHPESVVFGDRKADAARRDFTINAIYYHPVRRELFDPYEGQRDLTDQLIRFIGDPTTRILHDALRALRAVRFRADLRFQYDPETYVALKEQAGGVERLSGGRVRDELERVLLVANPAQALNDLHELTILSRILPEVDDLKGLAQPPTYHQEGDAWDHLLKVLCIFREDDDIDVRVAALLHDIGKVGTFKRRERIRFDEHAKVSGKMTTQILDRLQYTKERKEKIVWLITHHMMLGPTLEMPEKRQVHWYFHPWFPDLMRLFWLDIAGTEPSDFALYEKVETHYHQFLDAHPRPPKPLLTGEEVMTMLGIGPGERVGEVLAKLHEAHLQKKITTKAEAREYVRQLGF